MQSSFLKGKENKFYVVGIILSTILFVVFFTSKLWLYDDSMVMQTPFGKEVTGLEQTKLKLRKWEYNPEKELMEVSLGVEHSGDDYVKPTFTFVAKERDQREEYPVKVVYKDDESLIVHIEEVPEKYRVIGLFVYEHRDKRVLEAEIKEQYASGELNEELESEDELEIALPKPAETIIVGDYRKIKVNSELITKNAIEYQKENVQREIDILDREMKSIIEEKIPVLEDLIASLEKDIQALKEDLEYQIEEEKEESLAIIQRNKEEIAKTEEEIEDYVALLKKNVSKKEKLLEKLEYVSEGKKGSSDSVEEADEENSVDEVENEGGKTPSVDEKEADTKDEKKKSKKEKSD